MNKMNLHYQEKEEWVRPDPVSEEPEKEKCELLGIIQGKDTAIQELQRQNEKLINFVLSKTECCDVCPITDTCVNSEGTCPYAGEIITKGEEEVTREWLMQFISKG